MPLQIALAVQVANPAVKVQAQLLCNRVLIHGLPFAPGALDKKAQIDICLRAPECAPIDLDVRVGGDLCGWRRGVLGQGAGKRPAAEHVVVGNTGPALECDQLLLGLLGDADGGDHAASSAGGPIALSSKK